MNVLVLIVLWMLRKGGLAGTGESQEYSQKEAVNVKNELAVVIW